MLYMIPILAKRRQIYFYRKIQSTLNLVKDSIFVRELSSQSAMETVNCITLSDFSRLVAYGSTAVMVLLIS